MKTKDAFKITARDIPNLPLGTHKIETCLYIKVRPTSASYFLRMTIQGKRTDITLGSTRELTFPIARAKAANIKSRIELGEEVLAEREAAREIGRNRAKITFEEVAEVAINALASARKWKNKKSLQQWRNTVRTYAYPVIGKKPIKSLTRADIFDVLQPIWETKCDTASRLQGRLERIISYAQFNGLYPEGLNPAAWKGNLEMILPPISKVRVVEHHAAPSLKEAQIVAQKFYDSPFLSHKVTLFGMLTACRVKEFINAKWDEIDFDNAIFTVPPDRRKDGKSFPHRVPLSTHAIKLLKSVDRVGDVIFANPKTKQRLDLCTPRKALKDNLDSPVTMHGCRSTFRDWCAEKGIDRILAEKALMHATGNEVEQAYQRSDLLEQRREVMQRWSDFLLDPSEDEQLF